MVGIVKALSAYLATVSVFLISLVNAEFKKLIEFKPVIVTVAFVLNMANSWIKR